MEILIYITWFLAVCTTFASFFFDNKKLILMIQATTLVLLWTHLQLLWALWWAWFLFIQIFRNIFFSFVKHRYVLHIGLWIFICIYTLLFFKSLSVDSLAILPYTATVLGTMWCYISNTTWVRLFFLASTFPFTLYMFLQWSTFSITVQLVFTASILINIIRFDILKTKK